MGGTFRVRVTRCWACNGLGANLEGPGACPTCSGSGELKYLGDTCELCAGSGHSQIVDEESGSPEPCASCEGSGVRWRIA